MKARGAAPGSRWGLRPQTPILAIKAKYQNTSFELDAELITTTGITALFGPSGAGKSTLLKAIAGLIPAQTTILLNGNPIHDLPTNKRRIGLIFQDQLLFPHLSVRNNLRYGLRRAGHITTTLDEIIELLDLAPLLTRKPATLSGGERQRVAIGRAVLGQPRLLLLDEPLSSLDAARRAEILPYLARLRDHLDLPMIYVSHAWDEVLRLADTLALISNGRITACGPLSEIAGRADLYHATPNETGGVIEGRILEHLPARGLTAVDGAGATLLVPLLDAPAGSPVRLFVPAREVILALQSPAAVSVNNVLPAIIGRVAEDRATHSAMIELQCGPAHLLAEITADAASRLALRPGLAVLALIKSMAIEVFAI